MSISVLNGRNWTVTHMNDTLSLISHTKEVDAKLLDILFESDDLKTRVGSARTRKLVNLQFINLVRRLLTL